ncbi:MAG: putative Fe-S cluster assembly protein SufT [Ramlibacter sp.]
MQTSRREPFELARSVRALQVPSGEEVTLEAGSTGVITQELGRSFTVYIDGSLFRIDGVDADAIGKEPIAPKVYPEHPTDEQVKALVWDELREVYDPEIPCSIVDLGLVYVCELKPLPSGGLHVFIQMTVTAPGCGMGEQLMREVGERLEHIPRVDDFKVELVYEPFWQQSMMSDAARLQLGMM